MEISVIERKDSWGGYASPGKDDLLSSFLKIMEDCEIQHRPTDCATCRQWFENVVCESTTKHYLRPDEFQRYYEEFKEIRGKCSGTSSR